MSYTTKDLPSFVRGDDWTLKLTLTSGSSVVDITDYTFWMTLKSDIDMADPGELQVVASPLTPEDAAAGIIYITAPKAKTSLLEPANYNYDIQQVDNLGNVQTLLIGKVRVIKDITRSY